MLLLIQQKLRIVQYRYGSVSGWCMILDVCYKYGTLQLTFTLNVCWCECFCTPFLLEKFSRLSNKTPKTNMVFWVGTRLNQRHTAKHLRIIHRQTNSRSVKTRTNHIYSDYLFVHWLLFLFMIITLRSPMMKLRQIYDDFTIVNKIFRKSGPRYFSLHFLVYTMEFQRVNSRLCVAMMVFAPIYVAQM